MQCGMPKRRRSPGAQPTPDGTAELRVQSLKPQYTYPSGGNFDGERQSIDVTADAGDDGRVLVGHVEVRVRACRALDKKLDRCGFAYGLGARRIIARQGERRQFEDLFP